jgi:hypothetical protein
MPMPSAWRTPCARSARCEQGYRALSAVPTGPFAETNGQPIAQLLVLERTSPSPDGHRARCRCHRARFETSSPAARSRLPDVLLSSASRLASMSSAPFELPRAQSRLRSRALVPGLVIGPTFELTLVMSSGDGPIWSRAHRCGAHCPPRGIAGPLGGPTPAQRTGAAGRGPALEGMA